MQPNSSGPALYIAGQGSQYPPYLLGAKDLDKLAAHFYDVSRPGIQKLLQLNRSTGIETRSAVRSYEAFARRQTHLQSVGLTNFFVKPGSTSPFKHVKKLSAKHISLPNRSPTIGVPCTNQGNPGYDFLVVRKLDLPPHVDRMLLHGVGCAGGLSILQAAPQIAGGTSLRRKPARILAFACELSALFADSAAAFVLCNEYAMAQDEQVTPQFELLEWGCDLVPGTAEHMTFYAGIDVYRATLSRDIPKYTKHAIGPMFERLLPLYEDQVKCQPRLEGQLLRPLGIHDFDWALHPGGRAIIDGVAEDLQLSKDQLQASREIYRTGGNSSSASVLIVLDRLRLESKKAHIAATSFGPGLAIEMALLRMCQVDE